MPLESAVYVNTLNTANPAATDLLGQGDDHIRLIKAVLQATFPNLTGAVTPTHTVLNGLVAAIAAAAVQTGTISLWYGTSANVPAGYGICDGSIYAKTDLSGNITSPDLRDRVVIGAGSVAPQNTNHGASTASATTGAGGAHTHAIAGADGSHTHAATVGGTILTLSQLPAHTHRIVPNGPSETLLTADMSIAQEKTSGGDSGYRLTGSANTPTHGKTSSEGSGVAHDHTLAFSGTDGTHGHAVTAAVDHTHGVTVSTYQPAHALHFIMKL